MIGFVLTGHGNFALGVKSAVDMVAGDQEAFVAVPFDGTQVEAFSTELRDAITALRETCEGVIVFSDLLGGTPFNQAMLLTQEIDGVEVVAGSNLPMLVELVMTRSFGAATLEELVEQAVTVGKTGVCHTKLSPVDDDDDEM